MEAAAIRRCAVLLCVGLAGAPGARAGATDLFISEYIEGSSNNKYIEIFNGTGGNVDLSNYRLRLYYNGTNTPSRDVALSGTLSNNSATVYQRSGAALSLPAGVVAITNSACDFTGNDAVALYRVSTAQNVDIFGCIGENPGNAWTNGVITTQDHTLRRKASVRGGVTTNPAAGFPTLGIEWDQFAVDTATGLGSHSMEGGSNQPPVMAAIAAQSVALNSNLTFDVVASDPADGDVVVLTAAGLPAGAVFSAVTNLAAVTNAFVWMNAAPEGDYAVTFLATDKDGTTTQTVSIAVSAPSVPQLLISEYGEGSSGFDKYIEIFNFGSNAVNLSQYSLRINVNGTNAFGSGLALSGTLGFNRCYLIVNSRANATLLAKANLATGSTCMGFNGNDAVGLFQGGALLDVVGVVGSSGDWGKDVTLVRKSSVTAPSVVYDPAEWDIRPANDWDNVGVHVMAGLPSPSNRPPVLDTVGNRSVTQGSNLNFNVVARDLVDGDEIVVWADPVPPGAAFVAVTNRTVATGAFLWSSASPTGTYSTTFHASDKDGTNSESVVITVTKAVKPSQSIIVHFNEIQADDRSTDDGEFVELVAAAGTNLQGCTLVHYNGNEAQDGGIWRLTFPDFVVTNSGVKDAAGNHLGFVVLAQSNSTIANADFWLPADNSSTSTPPASLQNGPDGLVLYDPAGEVLDAVVWPAIGSAALGDIPVDDPGLVLATTGDPMMPNFLHVLPAMTGDDLDLQAPNNVLGDSGAGWQVQVRTPGAINYDQTPGQIMMIPPPPIILAGPILIVR